MSACEDTNPIQRKQSSQVRSAESAGRYRPQQSAWCLRRMIRTSISSRSFRSSKPMASTSTLCLFCDVSCPTIAIRVSLGRRMARERAGSPARPLRTVRDRQIARRHADAIKSQTKSETAYDAFGLAQHIRGQSHLPPTLAAAAEWRCMTNGTDLGATWLTVHGKLNPGEHHHVRSKDPDQHRATARLARGRWIEPIQGSTRGSREVEASELHASMRNIRCAQFRGVLSVVPPADDREARSGPGP